MKTVLPWQPEYTHMETEDGPYWCRCINCKWDVGIPQFVGLESPKKLAIPEERGARVAPSIELSFKVVCQKCYSDMEWSRINITIELPK